MGSRLQRRYGFRGTELNDRRAELMHLNAPPAPSITWLSLASPAPAHTSCDLDPLGKASPLQLVKRSYGGRNRTGSRQRRPDEGGLSFHYRQACSFPHDGCTYKLVIKRRSKRFLD